MTGVTLVALYRAVLRLYENEAAPKVIVSEKEAAEMTAADPIGHKWVVGEEYYVVSVMGA